MSQVRPWEALERIARAVPESCRPHMVIVGSLAAGYAFFRESDQMAVRTKDVDCLLKPFQLAVEKGQTIARQLLDAGWQAKQDGDFSQPGNSETPDEHLPAIRLYPPDVAPKNQDAWFIELLTEPASAAIQGRQFTRVVLDEGHYGLPSFRYLAITSFLPEQIEHLGIYHARPSMMALANLLEHPTIRPDPIKGGFEGRAIKRSNKDLGRVLALGHLTEEQKAGSLRNWAVDWHYALTQCFPAEAEPLASRIGSGLRVLLESGEDFDEAYHTCINGLLSALAVNQATLRETGDRILGDAVERMDEFFGEV